MWIVKHRHTHARTHTHIRTHDLNSPLRSHGPRTLHSRLASVGAALDDQCLHGTCGHVHLCAGAPAIVVADLSRPELYAEDKGGKSSTILNGALLAAQPENSIFGCAMDQVYEHIERRVTNLGPLNVSGPRVLGECLRRVMGQRTLSLTAGVMTNRIQTPELHLMQWVLPGLATEPRRSTASHWVHSVNPVVGVRVCVLKSHMNRTHVVALNATHNVITLPENLLSGNGLLRAVNTKSKCSGLGDHYATMYKNNDIYASDLKRGEYVGLVQDLECGYLQLAIVGKLTTDPDANGNVNLQWANGAGDTIDTIQAKKLRRVDESSFRIAQLASQSGKHGKILAAVHRRHSNCSPSNLSIYTRR